MRLNTGVQMNDATVAYRLNQSFPASFEVWIDDNVSPTLYRAESNLEGVDDINGAVFATVLQGAIDALTSGGAIHIRIGEYSVTTTISISTAGITLRGEGIDTVLKLANSAGLAAGEAVLAITNAGAKSFVLSNLCVDGNKDNNANGIGVDIVSATTTDAEEVPLLDHVLVRFCAEDGVRIGNGGFGIGIHFNRSSSYYNGGIGLHMIGSDNQVSDSVIAQNSGSGIKLWGGVSLLTNIKLFGNGRDGTYAGVWVDTTSTHNTFTGVQSDENYGAGWIIKGSHNNFIGCSAYRNGWGENGSGFYLYDATYNTFVGCQALNILAVTGPTYPQLNGFQEANNSDYNTYVGCTATDNNNAQFLIVGEHSIGDIQPRAMASLDLSAGATDLVLWHAQSDAVLLGYTLLYTEASSADAGVTVEIGRYQDGVALDDDYFDQSTSEVSQNLGYRKTFVSGDLTNLNVVAGDTITAGTAGGKVGTGDVLVILNLCLASKDAT